MRKITKILKAIDFSSKISAAGSLKAIDFRGDANHFSGP
jgi:hypothetical protein